MERSQWSQRLRLLSRALALAAATIFLGAGCTLNIFAGLDSKTTDSALLYDAQTQMSNRNWSAAIADFQKMSTAAQALRANVAGLASAYAGRCGLDMVSLASSISSSSSSSNLFVILVNAFQGASFAQAADCVTAANALSAIGAYASSRTVNENVLMAFIAMADIGVRLASSDVSGWDPCTASPFGPPQTAPGTSADASARQIGVDFNLLIDSLEAPNMPTLIGNFQSQLAAFCATFYAAYPTYATCGGGGALNLDATAWTQLQVSAIEGFIRSEDQPGLSIVAEHLAPAAMGGAFCL